VEEKTLQLSFKNQASASVCPAFATAFSADYRMSEQSYQWFQDDRSSALALYGRPTDGN